MNDFYSILNSTSLGAAAFSVLIVIVLSSLRRDIVKRVSLQLQTGIAFLDITRHIQLSSLSVPEGSKLCTFVAFYGFFSDHLYVLLNVGIALNLHLLLLKNIQPRPFLKWVYWTASVGISASIDLVPLSLQYLGKSFDGNCYLTEKIPNRTMLKFFLVHLSLWPGIIYCLMISILVLNKKYPKNTNAKDSDIYSDQELRKLSWTIALYPFTCFITMFGYLVYNVAFDGLDEYHSEVLSISMRVGLRCTGLINSLCLLLDHQVWCFIRSICKFKCEKSLDLELGLTKTTSNDEQDQKNIGKAMINQTYSFENYDEQRESLIRFL